MTGVPKHSLAEVNALTAQLLEAAMASGEHDLALTGLLSAYATLAHTHPCCTPVCVAMLTSLSGILESVVASRTAVKH